MCEPGFILVLTYNLMFYAHVLNLFCSEKLSESVAGIEPVTFFLIDGEIPGLDSRQGLRKFF